MKKTYVEPEFEHLKFRFAPMMGEDPGFEGLVPSDPQGYGEGHGGGLE